MKERRISCLKRLFEEDGGIASEKDIYADVILTYKRFESLLLSKENMLREKPFVNCNIIRNDKFLVRAKKEEDNYFIGISDGAILLLNDFFNRVLSMDESFEEIGSPLVERSEINNYDNLYLNYRLLHQKEYENKHIELGSEKPLCNERKQFSKWLLLQATNFLLLHELHHVINGHLDFSIGFLLVEPTSVGLVFNNRNFDIQTLEMDADCCAAQELLLKNLSFVDGSINIINLLGYLNYVLCILFRFQGDGDYTNLTLGKSEHPDPRVRQNLTFGAFARGLELANVKFDSNKLIRTGVDFLVLAEEHFNKLTGQKTDLKAIQRPYAFANPFSEYARDNWVKNLRPELESLSYVKLRY